MFHIEKHMYYMYVMFDCFWLSFLSFFEVCHLLQMNDLNISESCSSTYLERAHAMLRASACEIFALSSLIILIRNLCLRKEKPCYHFHGLTCTRSLHCLSVELSLCQIFVSKIVMEPHVCTYIWTYVFISEYLCSAYHESLKGTGYYQSWLFNPNQHISQISV